MFTWLLRSELNVISFRNLSLTCFAISLFSDEICQRVYQGGHTQFQVKFPVLFLFFFCVFFSCKNEHILFCKWPPPPVKLQLKPKNYSFCLPCPNSLCFPYVFIKFLVFSLAGKIDNQIPCFPCAVATLYVFVLSDHSSQSVQYIFKFNRHGERCCETLLL